ncbi:g9947 [Coccomyxa elongata]
MRRHGAVQRQTGSLEPDQGSGEAAEEEYTDHGAPEDFPRLSWRDYQRPTYEETLRRKEEAWQQALPSIRSTTISEAPYIAGFRREQSASHLRQIWAMIHFAAQSACSSFLMGPDSVSWRKVEYWGLANRHIVELPYLQCEHMHGELPAAAIGCFGSAPASPTILYEAELLRYFRHCWHSGMSAAKFCSTIGQIQEDRERESGEEQTGATLDDSTLLETYRHWNAIQIRTPDAVGTQDFSPGRSGDCGACAKVPSFNDQGIFATMRRAFDVLEKAERELSASIKIAQEGAQLYADSPGQYDMGPDASEESREDTLNEDGRSPSPNTTLPEDGTAAAARGAVHLHEMRSWRSITANDAPNMSHCSGTCVLQPSHALAAGLGLMGSVARPLPMRAGPMRPQLLCPLAARRGLTGWAAQTGFSSFITQQLEKRGS